MTSMEAMVTDGLNEQMPILDWDLFYNNVFIWRPGEHVAAIGPTGSGKTTLAIAVLNKRTYITVFATKPRDETMLALKKSRGYVIIPKYEALDRHLYPRVIVWPKHTDAFQMMKVQMREFHKSFGAIYTVGNQCLFVDELWWVSYNLKLERWVRIYLQQARSMGISLFVTTQRPRYVPLEVYDQSTHLFFWRDNDKNNLDRISGIAWHDSSMIRQAVSRLERHQLLYINTVDGRMYRTTPPAPEGG